VSAGSSEAKDQDNAGGGEEAQSAIQRVVPVGFNPL
jgi:hypothetical protein